MVDGADELYRNQVLFLIKLPHTPKKKQKPHSCLQRGCAEVLIWLKYIKLKNTKFTWQLMSAGIAPLITTCQANWICVILIRV